MKMTTHCWMKFRKIWTRQRRQRKKFQISWQILLINAGLISSARSSYKKKAGNTTDHKTVNC